MTRYFVGVDGGGTRTRVLLVDGNLREIARGQGPASIADPAAPERAAEVVAETVREVAERAGAPIPLDAIWAGIAGVGREGTRSAVEAALKRTGIARDVAVGTDVEAAFEDAFGPGPGILLVSGTGSIGWGRSEAGTVGRVGGWGSLLGDEGSGYAIGVEALRSIARDADGRGDQTGLEDEVLAHLGLTEPDDLVLWAAGAAKSEIAALAPVVGKCAQDGDSIAGEILVRAVEDLEGHVLTLLNNLGPWTSRPRVALSGGLLDSGGTLRRGIEEALRKHRIQLVPRKLDAAMGAAKWAERLRDTDR